MKDYVVRDYDRQLFKETVKAQGYNPTEFVMVVLGVERYDVASKKLNNGRFSRLEVWKLASQLDITAEQFCRIFFTNAIVDTI